MKNFKSFAAFTAASMISLASVATPIFAKEGDTPTFNTSVSSNGGYEPANAATFSYTITPVAGTQEWSNDAPGGTIFTGVDAGLAVQVPATKADMEGTPEIEYSQSSITCLNPDAFPGAGVFKYTIKADEKTGTGYEGITVDPTVYELYVNVEWDETHTNKVITAYNFRKENVEGTDGKVDDLLFTHTYTTKPLEITKTVTGNQGDKNQPFNFKLTIDKKAGQTFKVTGNTGVISPTEEEGKYIYIFQLADGQSVNVEGLTADDKYTVSEEEAGYQPSYSINKGTSVADNKTPATPVAGDKDETVDFTNTKNGNVPTGILMTAAPYVAVVGLGGIFAGMFFRRKRED